MKRWLAVTALCLLMAGCGQVEEDAGLRLHVTQFSMPYGSSHLLTYAYPSLELVSDKQLGSISARMALRPGGDELWIGGEGSNDLALYSAWRDSLLGRINLGVPVGGVAFDKTGIRCLVSHGAVMARENSSPNATILDAGSRQPMKAFRVGSSPRGVCFDPRLQRGFVANTGDSTLSFLDLEQGFTKDTLVVAPAPAFVTPDPLNRWLYVACLGAPSPEGRERGVVQVYRLPAMELIAEIPAGRHPSRVTPTPDGALIVVNDMWVSAGDAPRVHLLRVSADEAGAPRFEPWKEIEAGDNPLSGGMSPDGRLFAAPDFANCRVALIGLEKGKFLRWLQLPGNPGEHFSVDAVWTRQKPAASN